MCSRVMPFRLSQDYDHIVSLYEWESKYDDDEYHDDDLLTFR